MRCVFSETLKVSTLDAGTGAPPGGRNGASPDLVIEKHAAHVLPAGIHPVWRFARNLVDDVVTTCFPGDCRACGGPLVQAGFTPVCDGCLARITRQSMALCRICGEAMGMESDWFAGQFPSEGVLCTACRLAPPPFERAAAFGIYQDELREMIHLLKYERMKTVARSLGALLARVVEDLELTGDIAVVAVPLYPAKERQRGYNQAVLLADAAMAALKDRAGLRLVAEHRALRRTRDTESQFALTPRNRRLNLGGAFEVRAEKHFAGRTVLLVDDIYTTGATARECARILRRAGAARVFVATLARAQAERVEFWGSGSAGWMSKDGEAAGAQTGEGQP